MMLSLLGVGGAVWVLAAAGLWQLRWFRRERLADRLAPYSPDAQPGGGSGRRPVSLRDAMLGSLRSGADTLGALLGVTEPAERRLRRIHSPLDVSAFRVRQAGWVTGAALAGLCVLAAGAPLGVGLLCALGAPALAFLAAEQKLASASQAWQERVRRELPVVSEQLAMLLNAGYSLGAALNRLGQRVNGCCAVDIRSVVNRVRQGASETAALQEWAERAGVDSLERLVMVLALNSEAADLGRLVSAEARQARRDLHRRNVALVEKRSEQIWIPVSVATLVPGVILLAVPLLSALRVFANA